MQVVRAIPAGVHRRVGPDHVVVGEYVAEPEGLNPLAVGPDGAHVTTQFGLREHDTDAHAAYAIEARPG